MKALNYQQKSKDDLGKFLRRMEKKRSASTVALYKKFRNHATTELEESKHKCFQNYFAIHGKYMKKVWSGIKSIISHKGYNTSTISKIMEKNGKISSEPTKISNIFTDYFVNVTNSITENTPKSQVCCGLPKK